MSADATHDVIVIGAGIAGLTAARELSRSGFRTLIVERSRGVGGRCATRRVDGSPVDHGVAFLHGRSDRFCAEVASVGRATAIPEWPIVRDGDGSPCRPEAFTEHAWRLTFVEGVNHFARHLAAGLDVLLESNVTALATQTDGPAPGWTLTLGSGERLRARAVALTIPAPSAADLARTLDPLPPQVASVLPLVGLIHMVPCLTVIARYPAGTAAPAWDVSFPRGSAAIHSVLHDSRKRAPGSPLTLVIQARPAFSRQHITEQPEAWSALLLAEAAALHGDWMRTPVLMQAHRWSKARVAPGAELSQPVVVAFDDGRLLGFAGDGFNPAGGVEGAYLAGLTLAARFAARLTPRHD